jgi:hypothetical protein
MAGLVPAISIIEAPPDHVVTPCPHYRDRRDKPGDDVRGASISSEHALAPRMPGNLDVHIKENWKKYLVGSIRTIGVEPITHRPEYVTGYGMKGLKRSAFSEDDILIFPKTVSELPTNGPDPRNGPILAASENCENIAYAK